MAVFSCKDVKSTSAPGTCKERGIKPQKPYSGSLNIRIPSEIHSQLALKAQMTGRSINAIIKDLLTSQQNLLNA